MNTTALETILLPEDIASRASLHCLACRRRLGWVAYAEPEGEQNAGNVAISVSLVAGSLRDFQQGPESMLLTCRCRRQSLFHLL